MIASRSAESTPRRRLTIMIAALLAVVGIVLITVAARNSSPGAPQPTAANAGTIDPSAPVVSIVPPSPSSPTETSTVTMPSAVSPSTPPPATTEVSVTSPTLLLPAATPISLSIPAIGVTSALLNLGQNADGSIQVPPVEDPDSKAGWYNGSPAPGTLGPSILLGHIDSAKYGPGVFYNIGKLNPGDTVEVTRDDHSVAVFQIDGVRSYEKDQFPTLQVYGNLDHAGLRLITCGGTFNLSSGHYESNVVAYATLVSSHAA